ncbi:endolytic transglycosylase MltG [Alphaproteobacteria bacterium LSUCC0684]
MDDNTDKTTKETRPRQYFGVLSALLLIVAAGAGALIIWFFSELHRPGVMKDSEIILVPEGAGRVVISALLERAGIPHNRWVMRIEERRRDKQYRPKAGEFILPPGASLSEAMDIIHEGKAIQHSFVIPEGWTSVEVTSALQDDARFSGNITPEIREGELLPETYFFTRGTDRNVFVERIRKAREIAFAEAWAERAEDLPYTSLDEAIILASIIEKETGLVEERGKVASVFVNRLRAGMRLQSDPTVLYGLFRSGRIVERLTRDHLKDPSPWNTYMQNGLPPTPICNPGLDSLNAALNPEETPFFYFVADGKGGHAFARTLAEHNRNVRAWRALRQSEGN